MVHKIGIISGELRRNYVQRCRQVSDVPWASNTGAGNSTGDSGECCHKGAVIFT